MKLDYEPVDVEPLAYACFESCCFGGDDEPHAIGVLGEVGVHVARFATAADTDLWELVADILQARGYHTYYSETRFEVYADSSELRAHIDEWEGGQ